VFHHTLSEGNEVAYWLAKFGASSEDSVKTSTSCPPNFLRIILVDALEIIGLRCSFLVFCFQFDKKDMLSTIIYVRCAEL
jgi:hypothetical protein